ncbi:hypothetical protein J3U88_09560 [Acanthopleuribacter pedis]|uniref:Uncharacterized protein n=1 Tax=Acanthopleuribacter pedis TaxID=442870 RepID=A0A8J7Q625_9BACT|nr:hypothetical protein [Acanthopleuribacter pedis]
MIAPPWFRCPRKCVGATHHLRKLTGGAAQLLISFEYDQQRLPGPPFSISEAEVHQHDGDTDHIKHLHRQPVMGG